MCEVITGTALTLASAASYASAAAAVVGTAASLYGAEQQSKQRNAAAEQQRLNIFDASRKNAEQASRQAIEDRENQTEEQMRIRRQMALRLGTGRVSAGAGGIAGNSVDAMLLDLSGAGLQASTTSETNYARQASARQDQVDNLATNTRSQLNSVSTSSGPGALDYLGAGLSITNSTLQAENRSRARIGT